MKKDIQTLKAEIHLILTDPDTTLSAGAIRALNYINTSLEALAAQPAPDLSKLKPENQQQMREWMTDGSFTQRAIDTMFELSQEITALKAAQPAVPEGWKLERFNGLAVKLISPRGAWWTYDPLGSDRLSWELLDTMLSATPSAKKPANDLAYATADRDHYHATAQHIQSARKGGDL